VIVVGSVSALWPDHSGPAYQATKAGALAFARAAALEEHERGSGVRFSVVAPGMVDTPLLDRRPEPPPAELRERTLRPEDVAETCAFLAALPVAVSIPELTILPAALQALGSTG
jgi:NAD(P)-dependent dehydrogenase (short-subunit alcohol dehydrogenase family)